MTATACNLYILNGTAYTSSATYTQYLTNAVGCDSVLTLYLTVNQPTTYTQSPTVCAGQTYTVGTNVYTTSGTYVDILTGVNGCDSTVTTNLTIRNSIQSNQSFSLCVGQNVSVGANTYTATGVYTNTLTAVSGCDSIVTTNLLVNVLPTVHANDTVNCVGSSVSITATGALTYTWNTTQTGATIVITPTTTTAYTVTGTDVNGCSNTAVSTVTVNCVTGIATITNNNSINIYPNPATDLFYVHTDMLLENANVEVYDIQGRKVVSELLKDHTNLVSMGSLSNGVYYVRVVSNNTLIFQSKLVRVN